MTSRPRPIILGLLLNESDHSLIKAAVALARRLQKPLTLVHAVRPIFHYLGAGDVSINPYYGYDKVLNDMEEEQAKTQLKALAKEIPEDIIVDTLVMRDYPAEALATLGAELHASLIICGVQIPQEKGILSGFSTAFSLAAHGEIPILMLPLGVELDLSGDLRILIADNLEKEGRAALENALFLAHALQCNEVLHAHIYPIDKHEIEHLVGHIQTAMNEGKIPIQPEFSVETYKEGLKHRIKDDLLYRFHNSIGAQGLMSRYQVAIAFGSPSEELQKLAKAHKAQIMIFGRHHLLHKKSFALGKIPYQAMVEEHIATLVVPDQEHAALNKAH